MRNSCKTFWSRVDRSNPTGCWPWTGALHQRGYGILHTADGEKLAHRHALELFEGVPLGEDFALHHCDNPPCCRPDHLFRGDQKSNLQDASCKGRVRNQNTDKTHCVNGHEFTPDNIYRSRKGSRECRECHRQATRDWRRNKTRVQEEE
jgi:hypothetical protein